MVTVGSGTAQERTAAALYPTSAIKLSNNERRILFQRLAGAAAEKRETAAEIALDINKALCATQVPALIRIQRQAYNKKRNLSGLTGPAATSNMLLPLHCKLLLHAARMWESDIIDVTGNQRWRRLSVHDMNLEKYGRQPNAMDKMQDEIKAGPDNIKMA